MFAVSFGLRERLARERQNDMGALRAEDDAAVANRPVRLAQGGDIFFAKLVLDVDAVLVEDCVRIGVTARYAHRTDKDEGAHDAVDIAVLDEVLDIDARVLDTVDVDLILVTPDEVQVAVLV